MVCICADKVPLPRKVNLQVMDESQTTHLTSPNSSSFVFVSAFKGVEAITHTPPPRSLIAVDLPPRGRGPIANGLRVGRAR